MERHPPRARHRRRHRAAEGPARERPDQDGTSRLDDTLMRARLVDELRLWIMPVVVGTGQRLFEGIDTSSLKLALADARKLANGPAILIFLPN